MGPKDEFVFLLKAFGIVARRSTQCVLAFVCGNQVCGVDCATGGRCFGGLDCADVPDVEDGLETE